MTFFVGTEKKSYFIVGINLIKIMFIDLKTGKYKEKSYIKLQTKVIIIISAIQFKEFKRIIDSWQIQLIRQRTW